MYNQYTNLSLQKRLLAIIMAITFLFLALFARLGYVQLIKGKELTAKAYEQWMRDLPLTAERGSIYDRNGISLVKSQTVFSVYVRPNAVTDAGAVSSVLSEILNLDYNKIYDKITQTKVSEVTIKTKVDFDSGKEIASKLLDGVYLSTNIERNYIYDSLLCQVLGFISSDNYGQSGLEAVYNNYLKGTDGKVLTDTDIYGKEINNTYSKYLEPIAGLNLQLTVDYFIQASVEKTVKSAQEATQAKSVSCMVIDPLSGEILASAITPSYDLNSPPRNNAAELTALSRNSLIMDAFEPGSIFKVFALSYCIENHLFDENHLFYCPGYRIIDGQKIKCWKTKGHGSQTLMEGVANSCNCVFMDIANKMGLDNFYDALSLFGYGSKTGVDFLSESSGIIMNKNNVKTVDLVRMGFGQAIAVTPIQILTATASMINGGNLNKPTFLKRIFDNNNEIISENYVITKNKTISKETSSIVRTYLENVVKNGGGKNAYIDGYKIGGKTGTAQKYENGGIARGKYISSFIGYLAEENPEYLLLFIVDEPQGAYYGSVVAAPYAHDIFNDIIKIKNIPPDSNLIDTESQEFITVPDIEGLSYFEAVDALINEGLTFEVAGEGDIVNYQFPVAGTKVSKKSVVYIEMEE